MAKDESAGYWAAEEKHDLLLDHLHTRRMTWYEFLRDIGYTEVAQKSYRAYYGSNLNSSGDGPIFGGAEIERSGRRGEVARTKSNHYRNVGVYTMQLATATRPAHKCVATNSDYRSQTQCLLGDNIIEYYNKEKNFAGLKLNTLEAAWVGGEGFTYAPWKEHAGKVAINRTASEAVYEGDVEFYGGLTTFDVVRDHMAKSDGNHQWYIVTIYENKWDLAAVHPKFADEILASHAVDKNDTDSKMSGGYLDFKKARDSSDGDLIPVRVFIHKQTPALPEGRLVVACDNCILVDNENPYKEIPIYRMAPANLRDTCIGYSPGFDILGLQQGIDICTTALMTNNAANAIQNLWTQTGDTISIEQLAGGMNHWQSGQPPQGINLTASSPETYNLRRDLITEVETLSGINATVRGQPPASLKSGAALALVVSQAIEFSSMLEQSVTLWTESLYTSIITNLKAFSRSPRLISVMGKSNRAFTREFLPDSEDGISDITRVTVESVNPLSKTVAGRLEMAESLVEKGFIKAPEKYIEVLQTGRLDAAIEGSVHEMLLITAENESLQEGKPVQVIITENHPLHIKEHMTTLYSPEAKANPELVDSVLSHVEDHFAEWGNMTPAMLAMVGIDPMPQAGPPPGAPGPEGEAMPQGAPPAPPPMPNGPIAPEQMPSMPGMPNLPEGSPPSSQRAYDGLLARQQ